MGVRLAALAAMAVAGFLLGSCGGSDGESALTTRTDLTGTRPGMTATRPTLSIPTRTDATTEPTTVEEPTTEEPTVEEPTTEEPTTAETTTEAPPVTVVPPPTITVVTTVETETTAATPPPTLEEPTTTEAAEPTSADDETAWAWLVFALALGAASVVGLVLWRRQRAAGASWSAGMNELGRRSLIAIDDVLSRGSVVTGEIEALAAEARSLERRAPDDRSRAAGARLRTRLDDLAAALESDRALRMASPPPSAEQLSYSTALIRREVEQLRGVLLPPSDAWPEA